MSVKFAIQDIIHSEDILRYDIPITFTAACSFFGFFLGLQMTLILVLIIISHPLKIIKHHILELVDASPGEDIEKTVRETAERLKQKYGISNIKKFPCGRPGGKYALS